MLPGWALVLIAFFALAGLRCGYWCRRRISWHSAEQAPHRLASAALPLCMVVVLGSGGHTTEILGLLKDFDPKKYSCHFILADTDTTSVKKLSTLRPDLAKDASRFHVIPRSREVGQSWSTTILSTLKALLVCLRLVWEIKPSVLMVNGPGTCVPVVLSALFFELLFAREVVLIFVESICRVKTLSLTGWLLYPIADLFVVQWQQLVAKHGKARYLGVLL
mmetsp:Transcript_11281/g.25694  ORF Transcript_11281/g.25694 Transcript_11281/m.25694 type:complete len:220 (-) Transcript_11281:14-673(-)